jgi:RHS repeat-associated protein
MLSARGEAARTGPDGTPVPGTGIEQIHFDRSVPGQTRVTDRLGRVTTYRHAIVGGAFRLLEARGAGCPGCGPVNVRYAYDKLSRLEEVTSLDDAGTPLAGQRHWLDALGRPYGVSAVRYRHGRQTGRALALRRLFPSPGQASARPNARTPLSHYGPTMIAMNSVVPGRDHKTFIEHNQRQQAVTVTETGFNPVDGSETARTTRYRYDEINGRSVLVEVDGPLPNGPAGTPADSDITRYEWDESGAFVTRVTYPLGATLHIEHDAHTGRPVSMTYRWEQVIRRHRYDYSPAGRIQRYREAALASDGVTILAEREITVSRNACDEVSRIVWPDGGAEDIARRAVESPPALEPPPALRLPGLRQAAMSAGILPAAGQAADTLKASYGDALTAAARDVLRYDIQGRSAERILDDFGQVVAIRHPNQGWQHGRYDAAGRLVRIRDARGAVTSARYDAAGRLLQVQRALPNDAAAERLDFAWRGPYRQRDTVSADGRPSHATEYAHTPWGRVSRMRVEIAPANGNAGPVSMTVQSWYDLAGRLSARTLPGGERLAYRYYATAPYRGQRAAIEQLHWPRWLDGLVTRLPERWLDRARLKTRLADFAPGQEAPDSALASSPVAAPLPPAAPPVEPGMSSEAPGEMRDAAGLPRELSTGKGRLALRWNAAGQLVAVSAAGSARVDGDIARYAYDAQGRRASKHSAAGSEYYLYEGTQLLAVAAYPNGGSRMLGQYLYEGYRPVLWLRDGVAYGLRTDHRGALSAVATLGDREAAGRILWRGELDAWGARRSKERAASPYDPHVRLISQYADEENGLSYNIARYYDPAKGRFISPDPAGIADSLGSDVPAALQLDITAYAAGQPYRYFDPDAAARLIYYALTTDAKGVQSGDTQGFTNARWAFSIDGIKAARNEGGDAIDKLVQTYADNQTGLLYDANGNFLKKGMKAALWKGGTDETVDNFRRHYGNNLISLPQFTINDFSDRDAALLIASLTNNTNGLDGCPLVSTLLPEIPFGDGEDNMQVTQARGVDRERPANLQRIVNCSANRLTQFPVQYADNVERERVERMEAAAEMNETSALNKNCSVDGCPGIGITGQSGSNDEAPRIYRASYGRSQFVAATFIETLDRLAQEDKVTIGITSDIQQRLTQARKRAVDIGREERTNSRRRPANATGVGGTNPGWFLIARRFPCSNATSAWDDVDAVGALTAAERTAFQKETLLGRQAFIDMACFVPQGDARPLGEARNAFMTASILADPVLGVWLMDLYKSYDRFNFISRVFIRNNLRRITENPPLSSQLTNSVASKLPDGTPNPTYKARQRQIEDELAMRTARLHNGSPGALSLDLSVVTRSCSRDGPRPCDQGDYVKTFIGARAGRGDWRSLRCGDIGARRGLQLMSLQLP